MLLNWLASKRTALWFLWFFEWAVLTFTWLFPIPRINQADPSRFLPGDLAVTGDGSHVMAYLGESRWIEAHPDPGKVIVVKVPSSDNPRFQIPVKIVRWKQVEPATP